MKDLAILDVCERQHTNPESIHCLVTRFPTVSPEQDYDKLESEFLDYKLLTDGELPELYRQQEDGTSVDHRIDEVCNEIYLMKDPATGQLRFPILSTLIQALIVTPHSKAGCEQVFSVARKNRCETRLRMTVGTLSALLACKSNLFSESTTCYNYRPSTQLLKKYKGATAAKLKGVQTSVQSNMTLS